jgi:hypothetical protein
VSEEKQEPVVAIFRKWYRKEEGSGVIALFPAD